MKRALCLLTVILLVTSLFISCAGIGGSESDEVDIPEPPDSGEQGESPENNEKEPEGDVGGPGVSAKLEKMEYSVGDTLVRYWLYTPENATENMPLIVYLHGGSGKGDDLELITSVDGFPQYLRDGRIAPNAYVIIPQVSSSYRGWGEMKADVMKLISFVKSEKNIDENRISLTGHSMGGTGAWMMALAYPTTFSAVAPLSGSVTLTEMNISKLSSTPIWAIVGTADKIVEPESSVNFIAELSKANGEARLTELDGVDHFTVPERSYLSGELGLIDWLISATR